MVVKEKMVQLPEKRSLMNDLYKVQKKDIKKAAKVLANAFSDDPMLNKIFDDEDQYRIMYEMMTKFSFRYGNVVSTSDNLEGVMTITPHDKQMSFWRIIRSGAFFLSLKLSSVFKNMSQDTRQQ